MFTAAEFRLIRANCPEKLDALLENLNISAPDWNSSDEFSAYKKLDDKIIRALCEKMKSESIIDGYTKLMNLGELPFDYSETDNALLDTLVKNKARLESSLLKKILLAEKTPPVKPAAAPREPEHDYSQTKVVLLKNRKKLSTHVDLEDKLRNFICEHFQKIEPYNVIESIEISIKTRNGVYEPKNFPVAPPPEQPKITPPPFNQQEFSSALESLRLVDEIVKSI